MDVSCPSLPPVKLVGDKLDTRPHHAARICALGCRSAMCNLCFLLVIIFDLPHSRANHSCARAFLYKLVRSILSRGFSKKLFYARLDNIKTRRVASVLLNF